MISEKRILIETGIQHDPEFASKCLLLLYSKQTREEKAANTTLEDNNQGFTHADAAVLSAYATGVLKGHELTPGYLKDMQNRLFKYAGQLETILPHDEFD